MDGENQADKGRCLMPPTNRECHQGIDDAEYAKSKLGTQSDKAARRNANRSTINLPSIQFYGL